MTPKPTRHPTSTTHSGGLHNANRLSDNSCQAACTTRARSSMFIDLAPLTTQGSHARALPHGLVRRRIRRSKPCGKAVTTVMTCCEKERSKNNAARQHQTLTFEHVSIEEENLETLKLSKPCWDRPCGKGEDVGGNDHEPQTSANRTAT